MERQTSGNLKEFYLNWRDKHGEGIIGESTLLALMGGGIATFVEGPIGGLRFTTGVYAFTVGTFVGASVLWEAGRAGFISIRESIRERKSLRISFPKEG